MWIKHLFLGFIGLASGVGVAAGTFAFIIVIGVVPRMIAKCNRAESTILFENMIVLGGILAQLCRYLQISAFRSGTGSCMYMVSVQVFLWDVLQWHWQKS